MDREKAKKKYEATILAYSKKLNGLIDSFYSSLSSSDESNMDNYNLLDKEWKKMCYQAKRLNKYVNLPTNAFEKTIIRNRMISKIHEAEKKLPGIFLNTIKDEVLSNMVDHKENIAFMLNEYQKTIEDNPSKMIVVKD